MEQHFLKESDKIIVCKNDNEILLMSHFRPGTNMVIRFMEGNENSFLLPEDIPFEMWHQGRIWAQSWDNNAPFFTGLHGIIGANHGSPYAFRVDTLRHWFFDRDIGSVFTDDAGNRFVLTSVESLERIILHSDIPHSNERFAEKICGNLHGPHGEVISGTITETLIPPERGAQLAPHYRYNSVQFLVDGRPLPDGEVVQCRKAELHWDIDLILVDSWLEKLKNSPGKYISPVSPELPGAINCRFTTVFRPHCSRTVECELTFLQDFPESVHFGMMQFFTEIKFALRERLMPGMKKITVDGMEIDLGTGFRFPEDFRTYRYFTKEDVIDPHRLPDRSIDFFGNQQREIGVVLGYSLTRGITARGNESQRAERILLLPKTRKNYPFALERDEVRRGEKFLISGYQHYFSPDPSGVSCYHLEQNDGYFIYIDFVRECETFSVVLPAETAGRQFIFLEHDPSVFLNLSDGRIPEDGVLVFSASGRGSMVLQIPFED